MSSVSWDYDQFSLTLFRMDLFGAPHRSSKYALPKICQTSYNDATWHSYTLPIEDLKKYKFCNAFLIPADISIFSLEISNFYYVKKH